MTNCLCLESIGYALAPRLYTFTNTVGQRFLPAKFQRLRPDLSINSHKFRVKSKPLPNPSGASKQTNKTNKLFIRTIFKIIYVLF